MTTSNPAGVEGVYMYVLTLAGPTPRAGTATWAGVVMWHAGATRLGLLQELIKQAAQRHHEYAQAPVLFFSLEPNQL